MLSDLGLLLVWLSYSADLVPAWRIPSARFFLSALLPQARPFQIDSLGLLHILQLGLLSLIILIRSNRVTRQQTVIEGELTNARELQKVILPDFAEPVPGFRIETVYRPAHELGGDFFQILRSKGDRILLVIGDVAGKGLPAALLVSILIGAIRTLAKEMLAPACAFD